MVRKGIKERKLWSEKPLPGGQINTTRIARFINRAYNILILPAPAKLVKGRVRHFGTVPAPIHEGIQAWRISQGGNALKSCRRALGTNRARRLCQSRCEEFKNEAD